MPRRSRASCLGLLVAAVACSGDDAQAPAPGVVIDTVNGYPVVRNYADPPEWTLEPLFKVGGAEATELVEEFGRISSLIVDAEGRVYVADVLNDEIRVFDAEGSYVRTIGRRGAGPAEFGIPRSLGLVGDTLFVSDDRNVRIGLFDLEGNWLGHWPYFPANVPLYQTGANEFTGMAYRREPELERVFVRYTPEGAQDSVAALAPAEVRDRIPSVSLDCVSPEVVVGFSSPLQPRIVREPAPDGQLVTTDIVGYRLTFLTFAGDTVRVVERETDAAILTDEEWDRELVRFDEFRAENPGGRCDPSQPERPSLRQMVRDVFFDDVGRMWVRRHVTDTTASGVRYDVFSPEGAIIGALRAPPHSKPFVRHGRLHVVTADSMGVESVRVFRIDGDSGESNGDAGSDGGEAA